MPINDKQKIALLDINAASQATIETKLYDGYVIQFIVSLTPVFNKLLIVYSTPEKI
jgi:hypothetical protein